MSSTGSSGAGRKPQAPRAGFMNQVASATELPFVLVVCVALGGVLGIGIDRLLHFGPVGMLIGGTLGFVAGVREVLRRVSKGTPSGSGGSKAGSPPA
jgi:F0F1-type ATP synthase assembly protein I